jgi:hypothetical protein
MLERRVLSIRVVEAVEDGMPLVAAVQALL